jgi:signal transduction histidine kinase
LRQILLNFTDNAVKFTHQGAIAVRVRPVDDAPDCVLLRFDIEDTGIGVSAEDQKRLFTAFEQADGSTTRKYGGTGAGLAISKRPGGLVGGGGGVRRALGGGSTFWFTVRLRKTVEPVPALAESGNGCAEADLKP